MTSFFNQYHLNSRPLEDSLINSDSFYSNDSTIVVMDLGVVGIHFRIEVNSSSFDNQNFIKGHKGPRRMKVGAFLHLDDSGSGKDLVRMNNFDWAYLAVFIVDFTMIAMKAMMDGIHLAKVIYNLVTLEVIMKLFDFNFFPFNLHPKYHHHLN